jgi:hypothetical protein
MSCHGSRQPLRRPSSPATTSGSGCSISNGERWRVDRVETTLARPKGPFGKLLGIRLFLSLTEIPTLAEVTEELCRIVDADPDDLYDQVMTHAELQTLFRSAQTVERLIAVASTLGGER